MTEAPRFRRGDVILAPIPFVTDPAQSKPRPAVVIQNDVGNRFSPNLIVAAITTQMPSREYPTNLVLRCGSPEAEGSGLERDSVVQAEQIATISKSHVTRRLGSLGPVAMRAVDRTLMVSLGLA